MPGTRDPPGRGSINLRQQDAKLNRHLRRLRHVAWPTNARQQSKCIFQCPGQPGLYLLMQWLGSENACLASASRCFFLGRHQVTPDKYHQYGKNNHTKGQQCRQEPKSSTRKQEDHTSDSNERERDILVNQAPRHQKGLSSLHCRA